MGGVQRLCRPEYTGARSSANQEDIVLSPEWLHVSYLCACTLKRGDVGPFLGLNIASWLILYVTVTEINGDRYSPTLHIPLQDIW